MNCSLPAVSLCYLSTFDPFLVPAAFGFLVSMMLCNPVPFKLSPAVSLTLHLGHLQFSLSFYLELIEISFIRILCLDPLSLLLELKQLGFSTDQRSKMIHLISKFSQILRTSTSQTNDPQIHKYLISRLDLLYTAKSLISKILLPILKNLYLYSLRYTLSQKKNL